MPVFRHTERPCLVLNSLKVMYSTLCAVPQLRHCLLRDALLGALLARPRLEAYWVVRDPYQRLQSCFRDKFHNCPPPKWRASASHTRCRWICCPYGSTAIWGDLI